MNPASDDRYRNAVQAIKAVEQFALDGLKQLEKRQLDPWGGDSLAGEALKHVLRLVAAETAKPSDQYPSTEIVADRLKLKVGTLEIDSGFQLFGCKLTIDGAPVHFERIALVGDCKAGRWKINADIIPLIPSGKATSSPASKGDVQADNPFYGTVNS